MAERELKYIRHEAKHNIFCDTITDYETIEKSLIKALDLLMLDNEFKLNLNLMNDFIKPYL